eukprot:GHRR01023353.1.p1 GENE.GHRR01023353.1~~GHRR01023353.1.p1  ORF type:complete len:321 (+),score=96.09 GHRR01023353.1:572-1534(+)
MTAFSGRPSAPGHADVLHQATVSLLCHKSFPAPVQMTASPALLTCQLLSYHHLMSPTQVKLSGPVRMDDSRYAAFLKLIGLQSIPSQVPLSYPFVEAFRLSMLAMSHKDFPFNVLGAVLARNSSIFMRPLHADEALTFSAQVDPNYHKNEKGDFEIQIVGTATDGSGAEVWHNSLTVVVINPKRQRGGGNKPTAPGQAAVESQKVLAQLLIPGNAGRAYGALSGDRNPIHLHSLTSQLFGFKRPIAHAMYLVARLEAELSNAGYAPKQFPAVFETEFKRPTPLPAKLQAVVRPAAQPQLQCAVLTGDGAKEVVVGRLYSR